MVTTIETRTDALRRLAQVARESGVKLMRDTHGEYWATSVSEPGWLYAVTPESCGCRGFATHRRCRHVAALHAHLGYLDPDPTPPLVNEMSLAITPAGVSSIVSDAAPLSERRTIESADPVVVAFLSDVVKTMREMQYKKRPLDKQLTKEQWKQVAAKQLDGERLKDIVLG